MKVFRNKAERTRLYRMLSCVYPCKFDGWQDMRRKEVPQFTCNKTGRTFYPAIHPDMCLRDIALTLADELAEMRTGVAL